METIDPNQLRKAHLVIGVDPDCAVLVTIEGVYTDKAHAEYKRDAIGCASDSLNYRVVDVCIDFRKLEDVDDRKDVTDFYTRCRKWKVQFAGINGWYDWKASIDGGSYTTEMYDSEEEAHADVADYYASTDGPHEGYRIVPADSHPEEWSPYPDED